MRWRIESEAGKLGIWEARELWNGSLKFFFADFTHGIWIELYTPISEQRRRLQSSHRGIKTNYAVQHNPSATSTLSRAMSQKRARTTRIGAFFHVFFGGMSSGSSSRERRPDVMSISFAGMYHFQDLP
jgi:hypothetical protein